MNTVTLALRSTEPARRAEVTCARARDAAARYAEIDRADFWPLALARNSTTRSCICAFNEPELGTIVLRSEGKPLSMAYDALLDEMGDDWLMNRVRLY